MMHDITSFNLVDHGAQLFRGAMKAILPQLDMAIAHLPTERPGIRIFDNRLGGALTDTGPIGTLAATIMGRPSRAVRTVLFDKTATTNWTLAWHQDRTICVRERIDIDGFGPWTTKNGVQHVAPPFRILARMMTLRVHLDDVPASNAPLLIAPGSHTAGVVVEGEIENLVQRCGIAACTADAGDVWAYATPILHASKPATSPGRRRVLQIDFTVDDLPGGLEWATA